jgi:hypothetical protein
MKVCRVPIFLGDNLLNIMLDLPPNYPQSLEFILKDSAVALFPDFPKDESWKEQPNAIKDWIDEAGISPRGDYGSDRVLDAV